MSGTQGQAEVAKKMYGTQHIPGPWIVKDDAHEPCSIVAVGEHRHLPIAQVWATDLPHGAENARLIAASPDLLAACEALVAWHADVNGSGERLDELDDIAKAAIAKAKGY